MKIFQMTASAIQFLCNVTALFPVSWKACEKRKNRKQGIQVQMDHYISQETTPADFVILLPYVASSLIWHPLSEISAILADLRVKLFLSDYRIFPSFRKMTFKRRTIVRPISRWSPTIVVFCSHPPSTDSRSNAFHHHFFQYKRFILIYRMKSLSSISCDRCPCCACACESSSCRSEPVRRGWEESLPVDLHSPRRTFRSPSATVSPGNVYKKETSSEERQENL